jgi:hypothetical protein
VTANPAPKPSPRMGCVHRTPSTPPPTGSNAVFKPNLGGCARFSFGCARPSFRLSSQPGPRGRRGSRFPRPTGAFYGAMSSNGGTTRWCPSVPRPRAQTAWLSQLQARGHHAMVPSVPPGSPETLRWSRKPRGTTQRPLAPRAPLTVLRDSVIAPKHGPRGLLRNSGLTGARLRFAL